MSMLIVERTAPNYNFLPPWSLIEINSEGQRWVIGYIDTEQNARILADLYNENRRT